MTSNMESIATDVANLRITNARYCVVCHKTPVYILLLPCRHLVCCEPCVKKIKKCVCCSSRISGFYNTRTGDGPRPKFS